MLLNNKSIVFENCYAKINLSLKILNKRSDGYHNLESEIFFTDISDKILIQITNQKNKSIELVLRGPFAKKLPQNKNKNLIHIAAKCFLNELKIKNNIKIVLNKNLPISSGIGGGSADAAATLKILPKVFNIPNNKKLQFIQNKIARKLGSDVVACIHSKPVRVLKTGNKLSNLNIDLKRMLSKNNWLVLVTSNYELSTETIFKNLDNIKSFTKITNRKPLKYSLGFNNLKNISEHFVPDIVLAQNFLSKQKGINFFGMSGSGPTCFGVFSKKQEAVSASLNIIKKRPKWWVKQGKIII